MEQSEDKAYIDMLWSKAKEIMTDDKHRDTIVYWSCIGQELEDCWLISSKMRERLCSSISSFDPEWVKRCVPATEEQIRQLQDIFAECHYMVPAAYLYYLRRMGQNDGGLLENEWDGCEVDIGTVLELLLDRENFDYRRYRKDLEEGLFRFSHHWADSCFYMKLSVADDNPMVTDMHGIYVTESFEKYLFRKAFHIYQRGFTYTDFKSESVCDYHERKKKENCRICPYCGRQ